MGTSRRADKAGGGLLAGAMLRAVYRKGLERGNGATVGERHVSPYAISKDCFTGLLENKPRRQEGEETQDLRPELGRARALEALAARNAIHRCLRAQTPGEAKDQRHRSTDNTRNLPWEVKDKSLRPQAS